VTNVLIKLSKFFAFNAPLILVNKFLVAEYAKVAGYPAPPTLKDSSNSN